MDWFAQHLDNVSEWDVETWCKEPGFSIQQLYAVTMSAHYHKSVSILI